MKTIGVTGGSGFIGSYVIEELLRQDYKVVVFDRHRHNTYPKGVSVFLGDVMDATAMTEFAAHVDGIIHLAAVLGTQETIQNPRPAALSNVQGGLNFLEACAQYDIPGVNICVGNRGMYATYSLTKSLIEDFCIMFNRYRGTRINQVRAVNAYGPGQIAAAPFGPGKVRKIMPSFICRALAGIPIEVYGDGEQVSDMVYVEDVAKALVKSLEAASENKVFNKIVEAGPRTSHTVNEVATMVRDTVAQLTRKAPVRITHLPMRPGETPNARVTADTTTLKQIHMNPDEMVSLQDGINSTVQYFIRERGITWQEPGVV